MKKTITILLSSLLIISVAFPAFAQNKKELVKKGAKALFADGSVFVPARIGGIKRFEWRPELTKPIQRTLPAALGAPMERAVITQMAPATGKYKDLLQPAPSPAFFNVLDGNTPHKHFLSLAAEEQLFYQQEITQATSLWEKMKSLQTDASALTPTLEGSILADLALIQNDHLRAVLYQALTVRDFNAMACDLQDYFTLGDKSFEETSVAYTARYPHKRNLQTLRLLHNPFIDESFKTPIKEFLSKSAILPQQYPQFKQALYALQSEYNRIMELVTKDHERLVSQALQTHEVQEHLQEYEDIMHALQTFFKMNGRLPQWNTPSETEHLLYVRAKNLASVAYAWTFEPFLSKRAELAAFLKAHEPKHRSRQETLEAFERFVKNTGMLYPRSAVHFPTIPAEENQLSEDLLYWRTKTSNLEDHIRVIQRRYAQPEGDPFYQ